MNFYVDYDTSLKTAKEKKEKVTQAIISRYTS